jgi:hypothetical protein
MTHVNLARAAVAARSYPISGPLLPNCKYPFILLGCPSVIHR